MTKNRLQELLERHVQQKNSPEEEDELMRGITSGELKTDTIDFLNQFILMAGDNRKLNDAKAEILLKKVFEMNGTIADNTSPKSPYRMAWFKYAAAVLLLLTSLAIVYYFVNQRSIQAPVITATTLTDSIRPGSDRAVLTLSDGRKIELEGNGAAIIKDGSLSIENINGGLTYKDEGIVATNTMTTPKGGQYQLTLADGTHVWLNAASSISYPTAFTGESRVVSVSGEAYFEVAANPKMPFRVHVNDGYEINVLGTRFNVSAYADEDRITTALLEGSVNIKVSSATRKLVPGQIAEFPTASNSGASIKIMNNVSTESAIAWKEGIFNFNNKNLATIMRQLARWYDIEVEYAGKIPEKQFWGEMGMDVKLEDVLEFLEKSNVKFTYQKGRKLIVGE